MLRSAKKEMKKQSSGRKSQARLQFALGAGSRPKKKHICFLHVALFLFEAFCMAFAVHLVPRVRAAFVPLSSAKMASCSHDVRIAEATLELLGKLGKLPMYSDEENDMVLDALVTVSHSPALEHESRVRLHRLADIIYYGKSGEWKSLKQFPASIGNTREIKCSVPPREDNVWEDVKANAKVHAAIFGGAATCLRSLGSVFPQERAHLRELSMLHQAQLALSNSAYELRKEPCKPASTPAE